MMRQFEVMTVGGTRFLCLMDTSRYSTFVGFNRVIKALSVQPPSWEEAQRVCDLPAVDEAIRNLIEDNTGDNATCLVREIMSIAQP